VCKSALSTKLDLQPSPTPSPAYREKGLKSPLYKGRFRGVITNSRDLLPFLNKKRANDMIPRTLTLKGIYSYQQEQVIDFQKLTAAQLFGIFGPVGSGKSTILEAITFALYGETERLNQRDNRQQNMKNLTSEQMYIRFEFLAGEKSPGEYCF